MFLVTKPAAPVVGSPTRCASAIGSGKAGPETGRCRRNAHASRAAEVRRHDQATVFGGILQERATNPPSFHWIDAPCGRQCGIEHLERAVDCVAAEDSRHGALYPYTQLPGCVTRQWQQREVLSELVAIVNQLHLPGVEHRENAVLKAGQLERIAAGLAVLLLPILELAPAHEITRVGKGRYPPTVVQARVPADMIDMKVGAEHDVHRLWPVRPPAPSGRESRSAGAGGTPQ